MQRDCFKSGDLYPGKHFTAPYEVISTGRIALMGFPQENEAALQPRLRIGSRLLAEHEHENISMMYLQKKLFYSKIKYCTKRLKQCRTVKIRRPVRRSTRSDGHAVFFFFFPHFNFFFFNTKIEHILLWRTNFLEHFLALNSKKKKKKKEL